MTTEITPDQAKPGEGKPAKPPAWSRNAFGVLLDRYHPAIYRPRGQGISKKNRKA